MNSQRDTEDFTKILTTIKAVEVIDYVDGKLVRRRIDAPENTELTPENLEKLKNQAK